MPFPAIWTRSQRGQLSADYESVAFPGNTFIFLQKRKAAQLSFFRCAYCAKAMKLRSRRGAKKLTVPIVRASIEEGFIDDPDHPFHQHFCIDEEGVDTSTFAAKARYVYNKVKLELTEMPMTPRQAMAYMEAEVMANFPDPLTQQEIIRRLPSDKSAKRSFARRSSVGKRHFGGGEMALFKEEEDDLLDEDEEEEDGGVVQQQQQREERVEVSENEDPRNIPSELLKPFAPRQSWICAAGRERLANFFLIYRDPRPNGQPFLVFADIMGINLLHKCGDIVCDGNSDFYPNGFAQLYTFHAVHHSIPEEAHLAAFALLPNNAQQTYVRLFDIISERIIAEYGTHGAQKNWHFDNQFPAINGCRAIFVDDFVEGSEQRTANFAQLWHEHLSSLFSGTPHPDLIRFIRVMREELAKASTQAERIFKAPSPIKQINLDNLDMIGFANEDYDYADFPTSSRAFSTMMTRGKARYDLYDQMSPSPYFVNTMGQRRRKRRLMMKQQEDRQQKGRVGQQLQKLQKMEETAEKEEETEEGVETKPRQLLKTLLSTIAASAKCQGQEGNDGELTAEEPVVVDGDDAIAGDNGQLAQEQKQEMVNNVRKRYNLRRYDREQQQKQQKTTTGVGDESQEVDVEGPELTMNAAISVHSEQR